MRRNHMYANISHQYSSNVTWVVIADSKEMRLYNYRKAERVVPLSGTTKLHYFQRKMVHELVPVQDGALKAETMDGYQIGHQRRGTTVNALTGLRNTYEPTGNIKEDLKRRFVRAISAKLERFYNNG